MTPPPTDRAATREVLGKYELLLKLATGGMAEIFLARIKGIEGFEKIVVVKRILPHHAANREFVRLFLDEARLAAALHHPNVVQVFDVGVVGNEYFFSMEYVHGENLRTIIRTAVREGGGVPLAEALTIMMGVCAGVHYAHEMVGFDGKPLGIIHRDVSPANILVSYDGSAKLTDFGIAKAAISTVETRAGSIRGKVSYLSPEQCRGETLDRRADIFAIGIVLYELTTSKRLFRGRSDFDTMKRIAERPVPLPSSIKPGYPPGLERIVLKALAPRRRDRYQTAQELQLDLEDFAREQRLATSSVALARYMERLFQSEIAAWRDARLTGQGIAQHLARAVRTVDMDEEDVPGLADAVPLDETPTGDAAPVGTGAGGRSAVSIAVERLVHGPRQVAALVLGGLAAIGVALALIVWTASGRPAPGASRPPAPAQLQVLSEPPGATVLLDGARQSFATPHSYEVPRAHPVAVRLELEGFQPHEQTVSLGAGESSKILAVQLRRLDGRLEVRTNAARARFVLDGKPVGDGSGVLVLEEVPAGRHRLAVEATGFAPHEEEVAIAPRATLALGWKLEPVESRQRRAPAEGREKEKPPQRVKLIEKL